MKKSILPFSLALAVIAVLFNGCAPAPTPASATFTPSPIPPTITPLPTFTPTPSQTTEEQPMKDEFQRLITVEEITTFSANLGIGGWKLDDEINTKIRVCRTFLGESLMAGPNVAINCIWKVASGIPFTEAIQWLKDNQVISASSTALESAYDYGGDFALYTFLGSNGHSVYDAFLLKDDLLYWASIDLGTEVGYSPESLFERNGVAIDTYLHNVLMKNLTNGK